MRDRKIFYAERHTIWESIPSVNSAEQYSSGWYVFLLVVPVKFVCAISWSGVWLSMFELKIYRLLISERIRMSVYGNYVKLTHDVYYEFYDKLIYRKEKSLLLYYYLYYRDNGKKQKSPFCAFSFLQKRVRWKEHVFVDVVFVYATNNTTRSVRVIKSLKCISSC